MINPDEIKGSGVFTQEMKALLLELARMINYTREGGKAIERIQLNKRQREPIRKDRKRNGYKIPRACGLIHYRDSEPSFDGVALGAPSDRELQSYFQEDLIK